MKRTLFAICWVSCWSVNVWGACRVAAQSAPENTQGTAPTQTNDEAETVEDSRATAFQSVRGPVKEQIAGGPLLLSAYLIVWLLLCGYLWRLGSLQQRIRDDVRRLQSQGLAAGVDNGAVASSVVST